MPSKNNHTRCPGTHVANASRKTLAVAIALLIATPNSWSAATANTDILDLQLEDLLKVQVTSASKKQEDLNRVASAVYVISNSDIRRSGVTSIPEALRMVPGIQVAQVDSNKWAITARGFNGRFANKLLVMVDGRTVYTPSYSGAYWEMQNLRLEDVEQIEVTRGPGGSVWGANAVNGVINIITQHSADTLGNEVTVGAGNYEELILNGRAGAKLGDSGYGRLSLNANRRGEYTQTDGSAGNDAWDNFRISGRFDKYLNNADTFSLSADYSQGNIDQDVTYATLTAPFEALDDGGVDFITGSVLARWDHLISADHDWSLQLYYDRLDRDTFILDEVRDTYDLDFTHRFNLTDNQQFMWGFGYRLMDDRLLSSPVVTIDPKSRSNELFSAFIQDQVFITDDLSFTLGAKLEHNDYTGEELQPSAKISWAATQSTQLWGSVSKAVRTPTIIEIDARVHAYTLPIPCAILDVPICPPDEIIPLAISSVATEDLPSEEVIAYEMGMRSVITSTFNVDLALFYNEYSKLRSFAPGDFQYSPDPVDHIFVDVSFANAVSGETYGLELASKWIPSEQLFLQLSYTFNETDIAWPGVYDVQQNTPAPKHQVSLQTNYQLTPDIETNLWVRYVDDTTVVRGDALIVIDQYVAVDFNIAWQVTPTVEIRLVGQNLFDSSHPEYIQEFLVDPSEVERSIYGKATVRF